MSMCLPIYVAGRRYVMSATLEELIEELSLSREEVRSLQLHGAYLLTGTRHPTVAEVAAGLRRYYFGATPWVSGALRRTLVADEVAAIFHRRQ